MSFASAYNYTSNAPARPLHAPQDRGLSVIRGTAPRTQPLSPVFLLAAKIIVVALIVVTGLGFARIALNSATVVVTLESQELSASVDSARSEASTLEIQQSALANSERIKEQAKVLGMGPAAESQVLTLKPDVIATDGRGALSLSGSIENLIATG